jgi:drug/metabolite transporter (DMT)-like permease
MNWFPVFTVTDHSVLLVEKEMKARSTLVLTLFTLQCSDALLPVRVVSDVARIRPPLQVHLHHEPSSAQPVAAQRRAAIITASMPDTGTTTGSLLTHGVTALLVVIWYASSVVCNQSSKQLLGLGVGGPAQLTLIQLIIGAGCGLLVCVSTRSSWESHAIRSKEQLFDTTLAAASITAGFGTLNACMDVMHVSLVMVLRAAEPLTTLLLAYALLPSSEHVSAKKALSLLPVVFGCMLAAVGAHAPTASGLALALASNVCFSLRGILGKRIAVTHGTAAFPLFFQMCLLGSVLQVRLAPSPRLMFHSACLMPHHTLAARVPCLQRLAASPILAGCGATQQHSAWSFGSDEFAAARHAAYVAC